MPTRQQVTTRISTFGFPGLVGSIKESQRKESKYYIRTLNSYSDMFVLDAERLSWTDGQETWPRPNQFEWYESNKFCHGMAMAQIIKNII